MKISMAVSTPDARFSALALKGPYEEIFPFLKDCGYDGAELAVRDPALVDAPALRALLDRHGLVIPAVGTGRAFGEDGLSFSSPDESIRAAAVQRIFSHIDFCAEFNSLVIIGLIVGKSERTVETERLAAECMKKCGDRAAARGVTMVVEPINRYESGFITSVDVCMDFLEKTGSPACKILFDTFHANIEEVSIEGSIMKAAGMIGHVHVADSNRHHPGAGHTDFKAVISALRSTGYNGFLSAEILPEPDPASAARNNAEVLRRLLAE